MSEETTQIPVKKKTRQELRNISAKGETYNKIIKKLIKNNTRSKSEKPQDLETIKILPELLKTKAETKPTKIDVEKIAENLEKKEKWVSQAIDTLSNQNLIKTEEHEKGRKIKITEKGLNLATSLWRQLQKQYFQNLQELKLKGKVVSGLGEGSYYINQSGYQKQFKQKLGFKAYPGTLDLKLKPSHLKMKKWLEDEKGIDIKGFETEERSFGPVKCFEASVKEKKAAIVLPKRTHHEEDILEIISPTELRKEHNLEDGDELEIEVKI